MTPRRTRRPALRGKRGRSPDAAALLAAIPEVPATADRTDTVVRAGLYSLLTSVLSRLLQFGRAVVVARMLVPDEFGRFALVAVAIGVAEAVSQPGLFAAIIQAKRVSRQAVQTVWNVHVVRGALLTAGVYASAPVIASTLGAPETVGLLRAMSFVPLISSARSLSVVLRVRRVDLGPSTRIFVLAEVVETIVAIVAVAITRSAWGLVTARLVALTVEVAASYAVPGFRPGLVFAWTELRRLLAFGRWIFVTGLFTYASTNLDDLIVGRVAGTDSLGIYRVSYRFANVATTELGLIANRAAGPALARAQWDEDADVPAAFRRFLVLTTGLAAPAALVLAATSDVLIMTLLGPAWAQAALPLALMAVGGLFRAVAETGQPLFTGTGHPRLLAGVNAVRMTVMLGLLVPLALAHGVRGAAVAYLAGEVAAIPAWSWGLSKVGVMPRTALRLVLPRLLPAGAAGLAAWAVVLLLDSPAAALATSAVVSGVIWAALVAWWDRPLRRELAELIDATRRLRSPSSAADGS